MKVAVPLAPDGQLDPRWGRAERVAVAEVVDGSVSSWVEHEVGWGALHDEGTEGSHHARIARFLLDNEIDAVVVQHVGPGMQRMLGTMKIRVVSGLSGEARQAARAAAAGT